MKTTSAGLRTHLDGTVTTLATLWKITRTDGTQFFFTDHDNDLVFSGDTYKAATGYSRTAVENDSSLAVGNLDVEGVFNDDDIKKVELKAGLFDYAEIHVSIVNYTDPDGQGEMKIRRGWFGEVISTEQGTFTTELRGLTQALSQNILENFQPECRADLGDARCGIAITPPVLPRNTAVALGDKYRVSTASSNFSVTNSLINPSFEQDALGDQTALVGWTIVNGDWDIHDVSDEGLTPDDGTQYLEGGASASGEVQQTIELADILPDVAEIDAGNVTSSFSIKRANSVADDEGQVIVEFLDANLAVLTTALDTTSEEITPVDTWVTRSYVGTTLTSGTRFVRVRLLHTLVTGPQSNSSFDNTVLSFIDTNTSPRPDQEQYENRVYEVTTAGTTAGSQPAYDIDPGDPTTDGTAVLTAEQSFMRHAEVTDVTDRRQFAISVTDVRAVDDWFNGGGLIFETSDNQGRSMEIKGWTQTGGLIELFLPTPFNIVVGSKLRLYTGCDKRRTICNSRFGNVINFRGEPDLPGQDDITRYPDAR